MPFSINSVDLFISILYIFVIVIIARTYSSKNKTYKSIFLKFVYFKIAFAIIFALIHLFYFKGGDTFLYFDGSLFLLNQILENPSNTSDLLFGDASNFKNLNYSGNEYLLSYFKAKDIILISRILVPFSFLCLKQFIATTIVFTIITSVGLWKLYTTLCNLYPRLYKHFAVGVLFYPTIAIWGSGILKDTLTLMAVGLIFHSFYNISIKRKIIRTSIIILISTYLCLILKPYILYLFLPCMLLWLQNRISGSYKNTISKFGVGFILIILFSISGFFLIQNISQEAGKYSLENVESIAKGFQSWHKYLAETRGQSGYSLGEFEFTVTGILMKTPEALFVTFFRPFLFTDVDNFSLAFEGIQAFILLILSIYVIIRVGLFKFFRILIFDKNVSAFFLFAILYGITVGITSYNFGALSRYKIPCLPFFTASLAIIFYLGYLKPKKSID